MNHPNDQLHKRAILAANSLKKAKDKAGDYNARRREATLDYGKVMFEVWTKLEAGEDVGGIGTQLIGVELVRHGWSADDLERASNLLEEAKEFVGEDMDIASFSTTHRVALFATAKAWQRSGFPYYVLNEEQKGEELRKLLNYDHSKLIKGDTIGQTMHALSLAWSYFPHAWQVRCGRMLTPTEVFTNLTLLMKALDKKARYHGRTKRKEDKNLPTIFAQCCPLSAITTSGVRKALKSVTGAQGVSNFRPTAAAAIYHKLLPEEGGVVWDPSMGWGGRILGAVACSKVKKYIGCDPAKETFKGLKEMEADIKRVLPERQLETELHKFGSETELMRKALPEGGVDLVFSSPPYFDCEKYAHEDTQSWVKYQRENPKATRDAWLTEFMGKTLDNCRYALKPSGILAINIADVAGYPDLSRRFVEFAESQGWWLVETMKLSLSRMMGTRKKQIGTHKYEPIFVFRRQP